MDVLALSRIQFAISAGFHFIFVPLTIGLVILLAVMETQYARTLNPMYRRMADFWGKLFSINFVLGVVTGLTMEFQMGTNWAEYSKFMGDVFGSPLAIEAMVAFFLESTFMGVWIFGRGKLHPKLVAASIWIVAFGTNLSALWIITANGFMQRPVGYVLNNGRAELNDFWELVTNPYAWHMFFHTVISSYIVGSFFVIAVSAYHLYRGSHVEIFRKSMKYALVMATLASIATPFIGHQSGVYAAKEQPIKAAAMEAVWETQKDLPFAIVSIPNVKEEENFEFLKIPKIGSFLYTNSFDGEVIGLKEVPKEERPNVPLVFYAFRIMVALGTLFMVISLYATYLFKTNKLEQSKRFLKFLSWSFILPYIAINAGWIVTEAGRQPWAVYGLQLTADGVSALSVGQVWFSIGAIILFYGVLFVADVYLMTKHARKGPAPEVSPSNKEEIVHVS